jgi:chromosome segregation ATPase
LDEIQKEGYSSFGELREARESASNVRKEALRGELATLHKEIDRLENSIDLRGAKILSKYETEKQLDELQKQIPEAIQSVDQEVLKRLAQNQSLLKDIEGEIASRSRRRRTIEGALKSYNSIKNNTDSEIARIMSTLLEAGVAETTVLKLAAIWDESVESIIATEAEEIGNEILALKGDEGGCLSPPSICSVHSEIIQLQEQVTKDEVSRRGWSEGTLFAIATRDRPTR